MGKKTSACLCAIALAMLLEFRMAAWRSVLTMVYVLRAETNGLAPAVNQSSDAAAFLLPPLLTADEWMVWEATAAPPQLYDPPQKQEGFTITGSSVLTCLLRSTSLFSRFVRFVFNTRLFNVFSSAQPTGTNYTTEAFDIRSPDAAFLRMLSNSSRHPLCPAAFEGIWWMEDNIVGEGVLSFQDAYWQLEGGTRAKKYSGINWSVDEESLWGVWLTLWWRTFTSGSHQFEVSPGGKWINVVISGARLLGSPERGVHWIYVLGMQ